MSEIRYHPNGAEFRKRREALGLTQGDVAARLHWNTRAYVSEVERGIAGERRVLAYLELLDELENDS